jgi:hypothetical protein
MAARPPRSLHIRPPSESFASEFHSSRKLIGTAAVDVDRLAVHLLFDPMSIESLWDSWVCQPFEEEEP